MGYLPRVHLWKLIHCLMVRMFWLALLKFLNQVVLTAVLFLSPAHKLL